MLLVLKNLKWVNRKREENEEYERIREDLDV